jgi:hypothetical protein
MARSKLTPEELEKLRVGREKSVKNKPGNRKVYTPTETREHEAFIENALQTAFAHGLIVRGLKQKFGMGETRAKKLIHRVLDRWALDSEKNRSSNKASAERRILTDVREARAEKKWSAVASLESLLADIQGTRDPVKIDVDVRVSETLVAMVADMSGERLRDLVEEAREQRALASVAKRHGLLPEVIDAEGVEVPEGRVGAR